MQIYLYICYHITTMHIYIMYNIYIICIIYIYIYICSHKKNVPLELSPQWLCDNSCTWAHDAWLHVTGNNEPESAQQVKQGG